MRRRIFFLLLAVCMLLTSCGHNQKDEQKTSIRIGISLYRGDDTFINNIRSELEEKAKEYERENGIKVTLDIQDAKGSQNTQNNQVERFISLGCDVLCINPVDRMEASGMIEKAMAAKVPVVFFNRQPVEEDMNRWEQLYYIGVDAKETAILQGQMVVDMYQKEPESVDINGDGVVNYVLLEGESSHQDSLIRTEWSIRSLKDGGVPIEKITGGIANWERSQASALMEQWLLQYPGTIELVVSNNDDMALGAIDALERGEVTGVNVIGIDGTTPGLEAVRSGKMLGTVSANKELYASAILELAAGCALGKEAPKEYPLVDGTYYWTPQEIIIMENTDK
ncbi:galactose ABC transporter substrate-binding protein [Parablautia muri]|uniref:D-galactose/methyl-galactoside binding periplasmic protein MglB n=1 Tax=Parablautia muri TaxID=2320879 RepID=A0A9X5BIY0_9FIRM|nr:galactose ABC transporter substrate-binding protein [Parablautia muri]